MNYYGRICLDDIREEFVVKDSTGRRFVKVNINKRREPSKYGDTHYVKVWVPKAERKDDVNYYIGELKEQEDQK